METQSDSLVIAGRFGHERRIEIGVLAFIAGLLVLGIQTAAGLPVGLGGLSTTVPVPAEFAPIAAMSEAAIGSAVTKEKCDAIKHFEKGRKT